ncbi:MAG: diaminopimelate decarboxylase [Tissierellia bacterium]|nr:diaminopimelate decarboxylase [Tissierellia bacterium]
MKLNENMKIKDNELLINDVEVKNIKKKYDTPTLIIDADNFKKKIDVFKNNFRSDDLDLRVIYASKALNIKRLLEIVSDKDIYLDVVSLGEMYTAKKAKFDFSKIYFHGNNKLIEELEYALDNNIGTIVIDNETEYELLKDLVKNRKQKVLLRVNPGIDAHTHEYIKTSKNDSKFGLSIFDDSTMDLIKRINENENFEFRGFHAHIGSQIFEKNSFFDELDEMLKFIKKVEEQSVKIIELNLGGGFGVYYTKEDHPFELDVFLKEFKDKIEKRIVDEKLNINTIAIEPGRSLINDSGYMLYTIGAVKSTYSGKKYIFIDGGMSDNIRPSLYDAKYEMAIANKMNDSFDQEYDVAGKLCESGDKIGKNIKLPKAKRGDLLIVNNAGAYTYSMANNYNKMRKPAVVFIEDKKDKIAVKRQSLENLTECEI